MLVKIGITDITKHILSESYDVNAEDIFKEWTDANKVTHRNIIRQKISGSFELKFNTQEEYSAFCELIRKSRTAQYLLPMTLYVINEDKEKEVNVFYKYEPKLIKNRVTGKVYKKFKFEVEQP